MKPIKFKESTKTLQKPKGWTDEQCCPMDVWNGDKNQCISCWKGNLWDRLRFLFTGKAWVWVIAGETQPPIYIGTEFSFGKEKKNEKNKV